MRAFLWTALGLTAFVLAGDPGVGEDRTAENPTPGERPAPAIPSQALMILGGGITPHQRIQGMRFEVDCYIPGIRTAQEGRLLKVDESSLLLRAEGEGRFRRIQFAELFKGGDQGAFQAVVSRESDSDHSQLVSWIVIYSLPKDRPIQKEPSRSIQK